MSIDLILGVYALLILVIGTLFNSFSIYLCRRPRLRKNSIFQLLSYLFFFKIMALYTWNLNHFLRMLISIQLDARPALAYVNSINELNIVESLNIFTCKFFTFIQYFSLQTMSWFLSYISIDQVVKIYLPAFKCQHQTRACLLLIFILFLINFHIILFVGIYLPISSSSSSSNSTNTTWSYRNATLRFECYATEFYNFYPTWDQVHAFIYCFVPFVIMMISNLLLSRRILASARRFSTTLSKVNLKKKRAISLFVIFHSLLFIACSMPQKLFYGYMYDALSASPLGSLLLVLSDELSFTFIGFNFIFQLIMNKLYRREFFLVVGKLRAFLGYSSGNG
jgi:hypothetical protein